MKSYFLTVLISAAIHLPSFAQGTWQSISNFGSNPGNLNAYRYEPADMPSNAPLVVVMHGCTQNATGYSNETGWNTLADFHKFYVVHAEQKSSNNSTFCFNYWESGDHSRGQGEAQSIKQMVDYMKTQYSIDNYRVFATGLSAGGAMTAVMLSTYPDVFAAGAEMAGLPYKVATSSLEVYTAALGLVSKSPQDWGNLVKGQYPGFTGNYPRLAIFHGNSDIVINENNAEEMMKQFTNLHNTNQTADYTNASFAGNSRIELKQYFDGTGKVVIERYTIDNMAHGIAVDPGNCFVQGGSTGSNAIDVNFYSTYWAANFFGILQPPFSIIGLDSINSNPQDVNYSVTGNSGSTFDWLLSGGIITNGQGTNSISVDWVNSIGTVQVTETSSNGCVYGPVELEVIIDIDSTTETANSVFTGEGIFISETNNRISYRIVTTAGSNLRVNLHNISGQIIFEDVVLPNQNILLHDLPSGIYFLKCNAGKNQLVNKLVVK